MGNNRRREDQVVLPDWPQRTSDGATTTFTVVRSIRLRCDSCGVLLEDEESAGVHAKFHLSIHIGWGGRPEL